MPGGQERYVARLAHEFRSVIHHDFQCSRHVILEVGGLTTLCLRDRLDGLGPSPPRFQRWQRPMVAPPIVISFTLPLGNSRTSSALAKAFLFRFLCHIFILPTAVRYVAVTHSLVHRNWMRWSVRSSSRSNWSGFKGGMPPFPTRPHCLFRAF